MPPIDQHSMEAVPTPYPTDPYVAALIFMAGMSGVLPLGTGVNHRTKVFPANMYVAASPPPGTAKSSQLDELVDFPLRLVREQVALKTRGT